MNDSVWVHWRPNSKPFPRLPRSVVISPGQEYFRKPEMSVEQRLGQRRHRSQRRSLPKFMVREASRISCAYFMCFSFWNYILWYSGLVVQNVFLTMYPMTGVFFVSSFLGSVPAIYWLCSLPGGPATWRLNAFCNNVLDLLAIFSYFWMLPCINPRCGKPSSKQQWELLLMIPLSESKFSIFNVSTRLCNPSAARVPGFHSGFSVACSCDAPISDPGIEIQQALLLGIPQNACDM